MKKTTYLMLLIGQFSFALATDPTLYESYGHSEKTAKKSGNEPAKKVRSSSAPNLSPPAVYEEFNTMEQVPEHLRGHFGAQHQSQPATPRGKVCFTPSELKKYCNQLNAQGNARKIPVGTLPSYEEAQESSPPTYRAAQKGKKAKRPTIHIG